MLLPSARICQPGQNGILLAMTVCRGALSDYLWTQAQMPPEILPIYSLSRRQLEVARRLAGLGPLARH